MYRVIIVHNAMMEANAIRKNLIRKYDHLEVIHSKASSEEEVFKVFEAEKPDLAWLYVDIPGIQGKQLIGELTERFPQIAIVICGSVLSAEDMEEYRKKGALFFLKMPCTTEKLWEVTDALLDYVEKHRIQIRKETRPVFGIDPISTAVGYIQMHYDQVLKLTDAADAAGVSANYLSRLFHKKIGKSFSKYVEEVRMNAAIELLLGTDRKISDIAVYCGYMDTASFTHGFKRYTGMAPAVYRKERLSEEMRLYRKEQEEETMNTISREEAFALLKKYNKDRFHIQHALTVEGVMKWYAQDLGYAEDAEFWGIVGLLHDIDFELYPEEHCIKAPELLREGGVGEDVIHAVCSHGFEITVDIRPEHEMEKVLFAADELTGLIWACALMRPSKSVQDMEVKSLKKKFKTVSFAAGCSRDIIKKGCDMLGWELNTLFEKTILAMRSCEESIQKQMEQEGAE